MSIARRSAAVALAGSLALFGAGSALAATKGRMRFGVDGADYKGRYRFAGNGVTYRGLLTNNGSSNHSAYIYGQVSGYGFATLAAARRGATVRVARRVYDPAATSIRHSTIQVCRDRPWPRPQDCVDRTFVR